MDFRKDYLTCNKNPVYSFDSKNNSCKTCLAWAICIGSRQNTFGSMIPKDGTKLKFRFVDTNNVS